jgi:hypothetical protein
MLKPHKNTARFETLQFQLGAINLLKWALLQFEISAIDDDSL